MKKYLIFTISSLVAASILSANETFTMNFDKDTVSLVRKIKIYKDPAWAAKIVTKENKEFYFISPKSLMEYYYNPAKWPETNIHKEEDLKALVVTDYKTMKPIDAKKAFYVYGSHKVSLAGDDIPAFAQLDDAKKFMDENHGRRILKFSDLKEALIELLNGDI
ncbi:hypothetical protein CRV08_02995 [Halarcobacter ebronensis]|uniref:Nitrous oxide reductase accessory protein NosL n=1 Tax=Halarcobacter ebronensis TaxID=1462615 RepID=A0A4Q0YGB4_9BACT|nr:nitrous oxide reductase accessory protein NosL [Halarcobacter ebronensis]RXJ69686.1 hypothetical protein CRV08_02995 [Halarcobacter ebronensis]